MHRMIEQSSVHLPELVKAIGQPVSIYLVHLSSASRSSLEISTGTRHLNASHSHSSPAWMPSPSREVPLALSWREIRQRGAARGCVVCLTGYTQSVHKPYSLWAVLRAVAPAPGLSLASLQELCRTIVK